jgi:signal transduction histidine kinase
MNLLINSSEAIGAGHGTITLRTGLLECDSKYLSSSRLEDKPPAGRFVYVEVIDTGCGMDEITQQRIFEPFYTTKTAGIGTGLGLSVSYFIIAEQHNGDISVSSAPGQGACFTIRLPLSGKLSGKKRAS